MLVVYENYTILCIQHKSIYMRAMWASATTIKDDGDNGTPQHYLLCCMRVAKSTTRFCFWAEKKERGKRSSTNWNAFLCIMCDWMHNILSCSCTNFHSFFRIHRMLDKQYANYIVLPIETCNFVCRLFWSTIPCGV